MLPARRDKNIFLGKLSDVIFANSNGEEVDLVISLHNTNVSLRDFSAFLLLIDHFYGRNYLKGFQSYSMTERLHLRASELRSGSIEIIFEAILKQLPVQQAVYFFLLIRYLPAALKSISETLLNSSEAFYTFEKTKLIRKMRKNSRMALREDQLLKNLNDDEISKLADTLQKKYDLDKKHIYKAAKFASEKMKAVKVQKRKK